MSEHQQQIETLKAKCNLQLDYIKSIEGELSVYKGNLFISFFHLFYRVCSQLLVDKVFYEPKRETEINRKYKIIEARLLKEYILKVDPQANVNSVFAFWAGVGLVGKGNNQRIVCNYTIEGRAVSSVRVNRFAVEFIDSLLEVQNEP